MSKADILAIFEAANILRNTQDGLRKERAILRLARRFSEKQSERLVEYIALAIEPKSEAVQA